MKVINIYMLVLISFAQICLIRSWLNDNLNRNLMNNYFNLNTNHKSLNAFNLNRLRRSSTTSTAATAAISAYKQSGENKESIARKPLFTYLGCFNDKRDMRDIGDKDFTFITKYNKSMPTVELCTILCAQDGFSFAGVQAFDECYCGHSYGRYNQTDARNCFFSCGGKYSCGGYNANSVYFIAQPVRQELSQTGSISQLNNEDLNRALLTDADLNPCLNSPCKNSGICVTLMDDKGTPRGFICKCINPRDAGTFCEETNFCYSNPCLNSAQCVNMPDAYKCECSPNYTGRNCEFYDVCLTKPCHNNGQCVMKTPTNFDCNCTQDFIGPTCEILNPCSNVNCSNRGVCRHTSAYDFFCLCEGNFVGKNCDQCKPQFTGPYCNECVSGFTGSNCDQLVNYCAPNPCENGFCLKNGLASYKCICNDGWTGRNCTQKNCLLERCLNGGHCALSFNNQTEQIDYKCVCPGNLYGDRCEFTDPCDMNPCEPDEDCILSTNDPTKTHLCVKSVNICERMQPCNKNSECIYFKSNNTFDCRCLNGADSCEEGEMSQSLVANHLNKNEIKNEHAINNENKMAYGESFELKQQPQLQDTPSLSSFEYTILSLNTNANKLKEDSYRADKSKPKLNSEIPTFGFNYDNLYILLPVGLVAVIIIIFLSIVVYVGIKARSRSARFSKEAATIRNLHYISDPNNFIDSIKPIQNLSNSTLGYVSSEREYLENYGRV